MKHYVGKGFYGVNEEHDEIYDIPDWYEELFYCKRCDAGFESEEDLVHGFCEDCRKELIEEYADDTNICFEFAKSDFLSKEQINLHYTLAQKASMLQDYVEHHCLSLLDWIEDNVDEFCDVAFEAECSQAKST